jgi:hypothetical protein
VNKRSDNVPSNNQSGNEVGRAACPGAGAALVVPFVVVGACVNVCMGAGYLVYLIGKIF